MKEIMITLLLVAMLSGVTNAQNVATGTFKWNSLNTLDAESGSLTEEITTFITHGTSHLEWKGVNGEVRKRFQLLETIGEWPNAAQPGRIQYEVTDGTSSGTVSIRKNENETKIFITITSEPHQSYVLTTDSYQVL